MLLDIRVKSELPRHRKFKKLKRLIGPSAMENLITFWCNVAEQVPNGELNGWSNDDIADAADWDGNDKEFVDAMVSSGFLDTTDSGFYPHDWEENQPWVFKAKERSEKARIAGKASALARIEKYGTAQPSELPPNNEFDKPERVVELNPNPRTPSPSPTTNSNNKDYPFRFKKKVSLPKNFHTTKDMYDYAKELRYTGKPDEHTRTMILQSQAKGYTYKDWHAAWKTWLRNAITKNPALQEQEKDWADI